MREALDRHDELSARGRQRVLERYTWQRTAGRYLEVIGQERDRVESSRTATPAPDASDRISAYLEGGAGPGTA